MMSYYEPIEQHANTGRMLLNRGKRTLPMQKLDYAASEKEVRQVGFNPRFEFIPSLSRRSHNYAFAKLAEADDADEQSVEGLRSNPCFNQRLRLGPYQLRCNVGVQQKTTHSKSTGRAKEGLRLNSVSTSSSVSKPLTFAQASINA
jgi:hypothetical protein